MTSEHPIDLGEMCADLLDRGIRFLLVGRQAVRIYGSPVVTFDYDLWVDPACREQTLAYFERDLQGEVWRHPTGTHQAKVECELDRIDLIFLSEITNSEGTTIDLSGAIARQSRASSGLQRGFVPVPSLDDMIALKKCRPGHHRDAEDVRYLEVRKVLEASGELPPIR